MRVFHDDNRFPPGNEWEWVRTNTEALEALSTGNVEIISLDMDLGAIEGTDFNYGREYGREYRGVPCCAVDWLRNMNNDPGENGVDLVKAMIEHAYIPPRIIVHTWNYSGGAEMVALLREVGANVERISWHENYLVGRV